MSWNFWICGILAGWAVFQQARPAIAQERGNAPSRVVVVRDPEATDAFQPRADKIPPMVNRAVTALTGKSSPKEAWLSLVSTQDIIGLKVFSGPGPEIGTRPAVVVGVVEGLLAAGIRPTNLIVWDLHKDDLRRSGFVELGTRYGIRVEGSAEAGYDPKTFYESPIIGQLIYSDLEFDRKKEAGVGKKSYVSKLVSLQMTKIINITPLLNHNTSGVAGNIYGLAIASVDNHLRFESDPGRLATAAPEIYALPAVGDRVVLNIVDGLICQYEGETLTRLHYSAVLNELRFSKDPVALDVLSLRELEQQRKSSRITSSTNHVEIYLNAALLELGVSDFNRIQVERIQ